MTTGLFKGAHRDVQELLDDVLKYGGSDGWTIRDTSKNHYMIYPSGDHGPILVPSTPSGRQWKPKTESKLRRAGLDLNALRATPKQRSVKSVVQVTASADAVDAAVQQPTDTVTEIARELFAPGRKTIRILLSDGTERYQCGHPGCTVTAEKLSQIVGHGRAHSGQARPVEDAAPELTVVSRRPAPLPYGPGKGKATETITELTLSDGSIANECAWPDCGFQAPKAASVMAHRRVHRATSTAKAASLAALAAATEQIEQPEQTEQTEQTEQPTVAEPTVAEVAAVAEDDAAAQDDTGAPKPSEPGVTAILNQAEALIAQARARMASRPRSEGEIKRLRNELEGARDRNDSLDRKLLARDAELATARQRIDQLEDEVRTAKEGKASLLERVEVAERERDEAERLATEAQEVVNEFRRLLNRPSVVAA
jgi:HPt (histidine-containing phosphotransfer) domain-containing protein